MNLIERLATWLIIRFASSRNYTLILNRLIRAADDYIEDSSHERGEYFAVPIEGASTFTVRENEGGAVPGHLEWVEECEHGSVTAHLIAENVLAAIAKAEGQPITANDVGPKCLGGVRRELTVDYEAAAKATEELLQGAYAWDIMPAPLAKAIVDAALGLTEEVG